MELLLKISAVSLYCRERLRACVYFNASRFLVVATAGYFGRGLHIDAVMVDTRRFQCSANRLGAFLCELQIGRLITRLVGESCDVNFRASLTFEKGNGRSN